MKSPLEVYKEQDNKGKLRKEAFQFFNEKYFKKPFQEHGFLETEERFAVRKMKTFIPGRIYTWKYNPLYKDFLDYYDTRPMVLVHSQFVAKNGNMIVQGLNLNFLPEKARVQTLEYFFRTFQTDIEEAEKRANQDKPGFLRTAWKYLTDWYFTIKIFNKQAKIGYQFAYRNYLLTQMRQPVIIEFEDWEMIPYFIPKEFKGKSVGQVWGEYLKSRPELNKEKVNQQEAKINQKKYKKPR